MYPMLPTIQGTNHLMMRRVMGELQEMYQDDVVPLSQQYIWINLLLERTTTISRSEKGEIFKELSMYEALWDQSPRVRQIRAESEAEGRMKGRAEGRIEGFAQGEARALRRILVHLVEARFPTLTDLAQQESERINEPAALDLLIQQIIVADDENLARWLLTSVKK
jgi:predicted transposase YdaD